MSGNLARDCYPESVRLPVTEVFHGQLVVDPFRWLEDGNNPDVREWTDRQNELTARVLGELPQRACLLRALGRAFAHSLAGAIWLCGDLLFFAHRAPGQNQTVLRVRRLSKGPGDDRVLIDPNQSDAEGLVSLDWWSPSNDGRLVAYGCSRDGNEWSTLCVLDVAAGRDLADVIPRTRYTLASWKRDSTGFYYIRYPAPGEVPPGEEHYHQRVRYHALGSHPDADPVVFGEGRPYNELYWAGLDPEDRYLLVRAWELDRRSELYVRDETRPELGFKPVVTGHDALFTGIVHGGTLFILTNLRAPNYRIVSVDLREVFGGADGLETPGWDPTTETGWRTLIPESRRVLRDFTVAGGKLIVQAASDVLPEVTVHDLAGRLEATVALPELGSVVQIEGRPECDRVFLTFTSFAIPPSVFGFDLGDLRTKTGAPGARAALIEAKPEILGNGAVDPSVYTTRQVFYPSRDGTMVPMFVLHRKGLANDRPRPTVLTGYGGFNIARTPHYTPALFPWLDAGGVYVVANLRGGSEYGENWHRAGMLGNKQNVFDDFIAAAEYLIGQGYTDPAHLGILGGSNAGLLVGAAMTQRPDLFRAVVCAVPLLDMLRYHRFLIAGLWIPEYGSADDPEQFEYLYAYSPYHRVRGGERYPATLLRTAESDSRVDPMHARKMAALLQTSTGSDAPILLKVETRAGHGAGKPVNRLIESEAEAWTFLAWQLGLAV